MSDVNSRIRVTFGLMTVLLALLITLPGAVNGASNQITLNYDFTRPQIDPVTIGAQPYDRVTIEGLSNTGQPGEPSLPALGAQILLPPGCEVQDVEITAEGRVLLGNSIIVEPVGVPYKLSQSPPVQALPEPNPAIYSSTAPFPAQTFTNLGSYGFRGYRILVLRLQPVEYVPATGEVAYYSRLTVTVHTTPAGAVSELFRGLPEDELAVEARVDNPMATSDYAAANMRTSRAYDMLILTESSLASYFQPLKDYHDTTGVLTEIHTLDDVGSFDPADIRAYIAERYVNDGIQYVLIGADDNIIPALDLYVVSWIGEGAETEYDMPGDIYYACLDGTYNYDGDPFFGEPNDGEGGGDVDLIAEVAIGRAPVGSATEVAIFVAKTLAYVSCDDAYLLKVLMCGEYLGFGGVADYAGNMMDEMVDGSSASGYTTTGIPSDVYEIDYLYDRDYAGHDWPTAVLTNKIYSGLHIINHLGHGNETWALKMTSNNVYSLVNTDLMFVYSQACLSGHFDGMDCWAEYATVKSNYGFFALIMNTRYGWGTGYTTDGPSQRFNREFWDAIFNPVENKPSMGWANQDSKEDNLYRIDETCMRWCYYEATLFGDPALTFKVPRRLAFDYPGGIPESVQPGEETEFQVAISGLDGGTIVPGSELLHYMVNGGDEQTSPLTEISAGLYEAVLPPLDCGDGIAFYVSAEEGAGNVFSDPDPAEAHAAAVATDVITILDDNFETDLGWTVTGDAVDGHWDRGVPVGDGTRGDPQSDCDGSGQCYLTDNVSGDSDVDGGTTTLISPLFDASGAGDVLVHCGIWFSNDAGDSPNLDSLKVLVSSNDGADWTLAEVVGPADRASGGWYEYGFWLSDVTTATDQMRLRFDAADLDPGSVVEAAVDEVSIKRFECITFICGDIDGSGAEPDIADLVWLVDYMFAGGPPPPVIAAANVDGVGGEAIDVADLVWLVDFMFASGPALNCEY